MADAVALAPRLLRWQGLVPCSAPQQRRLKATAVVLLMALLATLPFISRPGLALVITACGALWLLWSLTTPPGRIGAISGWLLLYLAIATVATGFSPVPMAAAKGLIKLLSYLGVYALIRELLAQRPLWWDRLVAALLGGGLLSSVMALRQLYGPTEELAGWADPNSVAEGTIRIYGPLAIPICWRAIWCRSCLSPSRHYCAGKAGASASSQQRRCSVQPPPLCSATAAVDGLPCWRALV